MIECSHDITSSCYGLSLCLRKLAKYSKSNLFLNACLPLICSTTQGKILLDMLYCRHGAKDKNNDTYDRQHFVVDSQDLLDETKSEQLCYSCDFSKFGICTVQKTYFLKWWYSWEACLSSVYPLYKKGEPHTFNLAWQKVWMTLSG